MGRTAWSRLQRAAADPAPDQPWGGWGGGAAVPAAGRRAADAPRRTGKGCRAPSRCQDGEAGLSPPSKVIQRRRGLVHPEKPVTWSAFRHLNTQLSDRKLQPRWRMLTVRFNWGPIFWTAAHVAGVPEPNLGPPGGQRLDVFFQASQWLRCQLEPAPLPAKTQSRIWRPFQSMRHLAACSHSALIELGCSPNEPPRRRR